MPAAPRRLTPLTVLLALSMAICLSSCTDSVEQLGPPMADYFPLVVGPYREYQVTDSVFGTGGWQVRTYRRRETGNAFVTDQLGRRLLRLNLDTARAGDPLLEETQHWHTLSDAFAERIEGSDRVLALSAPILRGRQWDGNSLNARGYAPFTYTNVDSAFTLTLTTGPRQFTAGVKVQQRWVNDDILVIDEWELFAPGVGRVLRVDRELRFRFDGTLEPNGSRVTRERLIDTNL